jgi:hypothetical protein
MKRRNVVASGERTPSIASQVSLAEKDAAKNTPTPEEIRQRAFEIHIDRGGVHGRDLDDWLQAERELQGKYEKDEKEAQEEGK